VVEYCPEEDFAADRPPQLAASRVNTNRLTNMKRIAAIALVIGFAAAMTASAADAKENWNKLCKNCHGEDGKGQTAIGKKMGIKDYSDPKVQAALTDDAAFKAIKEGYKNADGKPVMKPIEGLSDEDIKALVAHIRTFKK
jgi:cytochrome c553